MRSGDSPTCSSSRATPSLASLLEQILYFKSGSERILNIVWRGLRDVKGSWKIIWKDFLNGFQEEVFLVSSLFFWDISPEVTGVRPSIEKPSVLFQPDSPTIETISPSCTSTSIPFTALIYPLTLWRTPPVIGKYTFRFFASRSVVIWPPYYTGSRQHSAYH